MASTAAKLIQKVPEPLVQITARTAGLGDIQLRKQEALTAVITKVQTTISDVTSIKNRMDSVRRLYTWELDYAISTVENTTYIMVFLFLVVALFCLVMKVYGPRRMGGAPSRREVDFSIEAVNMLRAINRTETQKMAPALRQVSAQAKAALEAQRMMMETEADGDSSVESDETDEESDEEPAPIQRGRSSAPIRASQPAPIRASQPAPIRASQPAPIRASQRTVSAAVAPATPRSVTPRKTSARYQGSYRKSRSPIRELMKSLRRSPKRGKSKSPKRGKSKSKKRGKSNSKKRGNRKSPQRR
jgi:hypothetical protein